MFVSYVVRLSATELDRGRFTGEVEGVATGNRCAIASVEQMAAFMMQAFSGEQRAADAVSFIDEPLGSRP